jgi:PAS domain S-box-containing protein
MKFFTLFLFIFISYSFALDIKLTDEEKKYLEKKEFLTTQLQNKYYPFLFTEEKIPKGYLVDLLDIISKKIDKPIKYIYKSSTKDYMQSLNNKELDFVSHYVYTKDREKKFLFSNDGIIHAHIGLVYNDNNPQKFQTLENKKVGVIKGYHIPKVLQKYYPKVELVYFNTNFALLKSLLNQEIDAGISNYNVLDYLMKNNFFNLNLSMTILNNKHFFTKHQHFVFNKENTILKSIFDKAILSIQKDKLHKLHDKWTLKNLHYNPNELTNKEKEFLKNNKKFNVCVRFKHYPLSGYKDKKLTGISGDVFDLLSNQLDINFTAITSKSYEEFERNIQSNRCDLISIMRKKTNLKNYKTTNPIVFQYFVSIGTLKAHYLGDYSDLDGHIFYVKDTIHKRVVSQYYPNINLKISNDIDYIMKQVKDNDNVHFINSTITSEYIIQKYGFTNFKINGRLEKIGLANSAIGVNNNHEILVSIINKTLNKIGKDTLGHISSEYRIKEYTIKTDYNKELLYLLISLIIISLVIFLKWLSDKKQKDKLSKLNNELNLFKNLVDSTNVGIVIADAQIKDYPVIYVNSYFEKVTGYTKEEILGQNCRMLQGTYRDENARNKIKRALNKEEFIQLEIRNYRKTGELFWNYLTLTPLFDENLNLLYYVGIQNDITKLKETQKELIFLKEKADKANKAKSEFLANMSHEIRTPLNGIIGLNDILLQTNLNSEQKDYTTRIKNSSKALLNVVNDILDYSKVESGKLLIVNNKFSLNAMLKTVNDLFGYKAYSQGLEFDFSVDPKTPDVLIGDSLRIIQVLNNFVGNAIKFTKEGRVLIKVNLKNINEENKIVSLEFCIEDTGIGISRINQQKLFKPFEQADNSTTRKFGGSGLGLVVSKQIVELMNGSVYFESVESVGSKFYFTLDLNFDDIDDVLDDLDIIGNSNQVTIKLIESKKALLVEDNETNQIVAINILENLGFIVDVANDGIQGYQKEKNSNYDIIFMDLHMPNMDGYDATKKIRQNNKNIPIVALSAATMKQDIDKSIKAGMNEHIGKPIDKVHLSKIVEKYFEVKNIENQDKSKHNNLPNMKTVEIKKIYEELDVDEQSLILMYINFKDNYSNLSKLDVLEPYSQGLRDYIHKLKGLSGNLKITKVFEISVKIYDNNQYDLIEDLKNEIELTIDEIENKLLPLVEEKTLSKSDLLAYIDELLKVLENYENIDRKKFLLILNSINSNNTKELKEAFDSMDYDLMIKFLNDIKDNL